MIAQKDFKAIAEIVKIEFTRYDNTGEDDAEGKHATKNIGRQLADYFEQENPRFDRERFLKACGL